MGTIQRQGFKNTIIIYSGLLVGFLSLLVVQPAYLSKSEIGLVRLLLSFSSIFSAVFSISVSAINIKYFPLFKNQETKHHGFFGFMLLFPFIGSILGCSILFVFKDVIISNYASSSSLFYKYFALTGVFSVFLSLILAFNSYCNAFYKSTIPSFLNDVYNRIAFILLIFIYYYQLVNLDQFIYLFIGIYVSQAFFLLVYIYQFDSPSFKIDWTHARKVGIEGIIKYSFILTITAITSISLKLVDMIMIGKFLTLEEVGIYSIAAFIATVIETPLNAVERIATAGISRAFSTNNMNEIKEIYHKSSRYLMLLGGFITVIIISTIADVLSLLPNDYSSGTMVTIILSLGAFINMATGVNHSIIYNSNKYYWGAFFVFVLLVITIVGNYFLIPMLGIAGAAITTCIASIIYNLLKYVYIWFKFGLQPFDKKSLRIFLIILLTGLVLYFIPTIINKYVTIIAKGSIASILFATSVYYLKIVPEFHQYIPFMKKQKN